MAPIKWVYGAEIKYNDKICMYVELVLNRRWNFEAYFRNLASRLVRTVLGLDRLLPNVGSLAGHQYGMRLSTNKFPTTALTRGSH